MLTKQDLKEIGKLIDPLGKDIKNVKKDIRTMKTDIISIRKDQNTIIKFFDETYLDLRTRIERIEEILDLPSLPKTA